MNSWLIKQAKDIFNCVPRQWIKALIVVIVSSGSAWAQSPELLLREFASGQVKKGVRSIGFGGDGATWGNYALVWKDEGTALADAGTTNYTNGNTFRFDAVGITSPSLWQNFAIYAIALDQSSNDIRLNLKSPGLGAVPVSAVGQGGNQAFFTKMAMPLGGGFSAGLLLSHEVSQFTARSEASPEKTVRYETEWRPSGGWGVVWQQPDSSLLVGFRAIHNRDLERRTDASGVSEGLAKTNEYRMGGSLSPWQGALIDIGGTYLHRQNDRSRTESATLSPNLGFEQSFYNKKMTFRFGLDESSPGAGFTAKFAPVKVDVAYIHNLGIERVGNLFGSRSDSVIMTLTIDYLPLFTSAR